MTLAPGRREVEWLLSAAQAGRASATCGNVAGSGHSGRTSQQSAQARYPGDLYLFHAWGLFADAGLQVVYITLGFVGMWMWRRRVVGPGFAQAERAPAAHLGLVALAVCAGTLAVREYLLAAGGSAPLWDALLTSGSLGAQYLLIRKYIENWYLWAVVDIGYIALFAGRGFYLSALLYVVFLVMVARAAVEWRDLLAPRSRALEGRP
jgi:nicotinamide mononucleotide transporter